jgi:glycosyltransferase involved in cell wall biosynthesis
MYSHLKTILNAQRRPRFVVWDWHNIESELMYRYSLQAQTPFHKVYLRRTANQLKLLESEILASCDLHLVTSERERDQLSRINSAARIVTVENGVDASRFGPHFAQPDDEEMWRHRNHVIFVGTMDYHPNIDAVNYFCDEVWPELHRRLPLAIFSIVGRNPPAKVLDLSRRPGVEVTGTVSDVRPYYKKAFAVVVPLRMGGGTRLKILEAMAAGVPVISTTLGAEGLAAHPGRHIEIADTPADFIRHLSSLRADLGRCQRLAEAGRGLVESRYDWSFIGGQLADVYRRLLTPLPSLGFSHSVPIDLVPVSSIFGDSSL